MFLGESIKMSRALKGSVVFNIVPVYGRESETFIRQRIHENVQMGIKNIIYSDYVNGSIGNERAVYLIAKGRFKNKLNQVKYKLKDIILGNYNTLSSKDLSNQLNKIQPDVIHCHFGYQLYSLLQALRRTRFKSRLIISFHGSDVLSFLTMYSDQITTVQDLVHEYDATLTFPTIFLKNRFLSKCTISSDNLEVVPNTFEPSFISSDRNVRIKPMQKLKLLNVSRLVNWKGHKYLISGLAKFINEFSPDVALTIIGSGEELKNLRSLAIEHNILEYIEFRGSVSHEEVKRIMKESNVFVHTAIKDPLTNQEESFGIALLEAISSKLFCISTDTGGLSDVIGYNYLPRNNFIIIKEKESNEVYHALKDLYLNGGSVDDVFVQNRVEAFSIENVNNRWKSIYKLCN